MKQSWIIALFLLGFSTCAHATTIYVNAGDDLQAALNAAQCGDTLVLHAGVSFSGNFVLPYKGACTGTDADIITIETSNLTGLPPAGSRITPSYASAMSKVIANSAFPAFEAEALAHHYKFIGIEITNVGGSVVTEELVMLGSRSSGGPIPFLQHPNHITFDRTWIHEATNDTTTPDNTTTTAIRGMDINATDITVTESRIAGFRAYRPVPQGVEASNAVLFPNSALRATVKNTYLEAWFCPVFFGGSAGETPNFATLTNPTWSSMTNTGSAVFSTTQNLHVGDLVAFFTTGGTTPLTNPAHPGEPVAYEVAKVTAINGSTISYLSWGSPDGDITSGNPLLQVPDAPGNAQWNGYLNQDITIQNNEFNLAFNATESVWVGSGGSPTTMPRSTQVNTGDGPKGYIEIKMAKNLLIDKNIFEGWTDGFTVTSRNQGDSLTSGGFPWSGLFNVTISNNWWKHTQNWDRIYSGPIGGPFLEDSEFSSVRSGPFTMTNNLVDTGVDAFFASFGAADNVTMTHNTWPSRAVAADDGAASGPGNLFLGVFATNNNFIFKDNIVANNAYGVNCQGPPPCWSGTVDNHNVIIDNRTLIDQQSNGPLDPLYPMDHIAVGQSAVGWVDPANANYALAASSPYKNTASDGTDPGVNMSALPTGGGGSGSPGSPSHHHHH